MTATYNLINISGRLVDEQETRDGAVWPAPEVSVRVSIANAPFSRTIEHFRRSHKRALRRWASHLHRLYARVDARSYRRQAPATSRRRRVARGNSRCRRTSPRLLGAVGDPTARSRRRCRRVASHGVASLRNARGTRQSGHHALARRALDARVAEAISRSSGDTAQVAAMQQPNADFADGSRDS